MATQVLGAGTINRNVRSGKAKELEKYETAEEK